MRFYEAEPYFAPVFSKSEIQEKINRWSSSGGDGGVVDQFISKYTLMLESAPEENPHTLCKWTFQKDSYYYYAPEEAENCDTSDDNDVIQATVNINGIPYLFSASTRNKADFKLNYLYARPYDGECPGELDYQVFRSRLCRTEKPDEETINNVKEQAAEMLDDMELGQWQIDECYVETAGSSIQPEYIIHIRAVPVFEQTAALRRAQLGNLKSEATYASNYYFTDAEFQLSADGKLVYFNMNAPVDVRSVINSNVQVLSLEKLLELAKKHFSLSDYYEYDTIGLAEQIEEEVGCKVDISAVDYGLTRVKVPNTDESYYYVPAILFWGTTELYGKETGNIYYAGDREGIPLLILNAVDGTVINATNM